MELTVFLFHTGHGDGSRATAGNRNHSLRTPRVQCYIVACFGLERSMKRKCGQTCVSSMAGLINAHLLSILEDFLSNIQDRCLSMCVIVCVLWCGAWLNELHVATPSSVQQLWHLGQMLVRGLLWSSVRSMCVSSSQSDRHQISPDPEPATRGSEIWLFLILHS